MVAALLVLAADGAAAGRTQAFRLVYQGFLADLPVVSATVDVSLPAGAQGSGSYKMGADIGMVGSFAQMFPFRLQAQAVGAAAQSGLAPQRYTSDTTSFGEVQHVRLDYGKAGAVRTTFQPPLEGSDADRRKLARNTIDPLSAIAAIVNVLARDGQCNVTVSVFDGIRRYDLALSHVGKAQVMRLRKSFYEGPAVECRAVPTLRAGFRERDVQAGMYPTEASLWVAPALEGAPLVPVRMLARSGIGTVRLDLMAAERLP